MVKKMSVLILVFWNVHGLLRREIVAERHGQQAAASGPVFAPMNTPRERDMVTPLTPSVPVLSRFSSADEFERRLWAAIDARSMAGITRLVQENRQKTNDCINRCYVRDGISQPPLVWAARRGDTAVFVALLAYGADPFLPDERQCDAHLLAFVHNELGNPEFLGKIESKHQVQRRIHRNNEQQNALFIFVDALIKRGYQVKWEEKVRALLKYGISPTDTDKKGMSAARLASSRRNVQLIKALSDSDFAAH